MKLENYEVHLPSYSIGSSFTTRSVRYASRMEKPFWSSEEKKRLPLPTIKSKQP